MCPFVQLRSLFRKIKICRDIFWYTFDCLKGHGPKISGAENTSRAPIQPGFCPPRQKMAFNWEPWWKVEHKLWWNGSSTRSRIFLKMETRYTVEVRFMYVLTFCQILKIDLPTPLYPSRPHGGSVASFKMTLPSVATRQQHRVFNVHLQFPYQILNRDT